MKEKIIFDGWKFRKRKSEREKSVGKPERIEKEEGEKNVKKIRQRGRK